MTIMGIKTLPLSFFEKQGSKSTAPIWGINTADQSEIQTMAEVIISVPSRNGQDPDILRIAQTWLPQELTQNIQRNRLISSSQFRKAVSNRLIGLIDEETAERMMRQSGAKEEQLRLRAKMAHVRKSGAPRTIADSGSTVTRADGTRDEDDLNKTVVIDHGEETKSVAELAANGVEDFEPGITPAFNMWVQKLNSGSDANAKNEIKSRRSYKQAELRFLARSLNKRFKESIAFVERNISKKAA